MMLGIGKEANDDSVFNLVFGADPNICHSNGAFHVRGYREPKHVEVRFCVQRLASST
jgi:hypothetical protein